VLVVDKGAPQRLVHREGAGQVLAGRVEGVGEAEVVLRGPQHPALLDATGLATAAAATTTTTTTSTTTTGSGHQGNCQGKSHHAEQTSSLAHQSSPFRRWTIVLP
jgi:hypothetical protein